MTKNKEYNKKYMTFRQEEKQTEQEISKSIKKAERYHSCIYQSHKIEKFFNPTLGKYVWLLEVTVLKPKKYLSTTD